MESFAAASKRICDFLNYFEEQWLRKLSGWYKVAALGFPSTNNGIEGANAVIKRNHTLRDRLLPVGQFIHKVVNILENWSDLRNPASANNVEFHGETTTISLKHWIEVYKWVRFLGLYMPDVYKENH